MNGDFHFSIAVNSIEASTRFFVDVLGASVQHVEPAYTNLDWYGTQLTFTPATTAIEPAGDFHFGINIDYESFDALAERVRAAAPTAIVKQPAVVDAGTSLERRKLLLRCPSGYLVEIKGRPGKAHS